MTLSSMIWLAADRSMPNASASASPSPQATSWMATCRLIASFSASALPLASLTCRTARPSTSSTGRARSRPADGPPTMIMTWPASAASRLPDTGVSSMLAPVRATSAAMWALTSGSTVLQSATTCRGASPATNPPAPSATARRAAESHTMQMSTSACSATARGLGWTITPEPRSASARCGVRLHACTSCPALTSRRANLDPMAPVPMTPTRSGMAAASFMVILRCLAGRAPGQHLVHEQLARPQVGLGDQELVQLIEAGAGADAHLVEQDLLQRAARLPGLHRCLVDHFVGLGLAELGRDVHHRRLRQHQVAELVKVPAHGVRMHNYAP